MIPFVSIVRYMCCLLVSAGVHEGIGPTPVTTPCPARRLYPGVST